MTDGFHFVCGSHLRIGFQATSGSHFCHGLQPYYGSHPSWVGFHWAPGSHSHLARIFYMVFNFCLARINTMVFNYLTARSHSRFHANIWFPLFWWLAYFFWVSRVLWLGAPRIDVLVFKFPMARISGLLARNTWLEFTIGLARKDSMVFILSVALARTVRLVGFALP